MKKRLQIKKANMYKTHVKSSLLYGWSLRIVSCNFLYIYNNQFNQNSNFPFKKMPWNIVLYWILIHDVVISWSWSSYLCQWSHLSRPGHGNKTKENQLSFFYWPSLILNHSKYWFTENIASEHRDVYCVFMAEMRLRLQFYKDVRFDFIGDTKLHY